MASHCVMCRIAITNREGDVWRLLILGEYNTLFSLTVAFNWTTVLVSVYGPIRGIDLFTILQYRGLLLNHFWHFLTFFVSHLQFLDILSSKTLSSNSASSESQHCHHLGFLVTPKHVYFLLSSRFVAADFKAKGKTQTAGGVAANGHMW